MNKIIEELRTLSRTMQNRATQNMAAGGRKGEVKRHMIDVGHIVLVLVLSIVFFTGLSYLFDNGLLMLGIPIVTLVYAVIVKGAPV